MGGGVGVLCVSPGNRVCLHSGSGWCCGVMCSLGACLFTSGPGVWGTLSVTPHPPCCGPTQTSAPSPLASARPAPHTSLLASYLLSVWDSPFPRLLVCPCLSQSPRPLHDRAAALGAGPLVSGGVRKVKGGTLGVCMWKGASFHIARF